MKCKIVILVLLLILTGGCNVNYNLKIDENNNFIETTILESEGNEGRPKEYLYSLYLEEYPIFNSQEFMYYAPQEKKSGNSYYIKNIYETEKGYKAIYKANYNINNYSDSRFLNTTFNNINIGYNLDEEYYYIQLSKINIFNNNTEITKINIDIEIPSNYVVISNNATKISNNVYTWNFTEQDNKLYFTYQDKKTYDSKNEKKVREIKDNKEDNSIIIVMLGLIGFAFVLTIIILINNKRK